MYWVDNSDPFVAPHRIDDFICDELPKIGTQHCQINRHYEYTVNNKTEVHDNHIILDKTDEWTRWKIPLYRVTLEGARAGNLEMDTAYCRFIPRAAENPAFVGKPVPSAFTSLPISKDRWDRIANSFYLPGHYAKVVERRTPSVVSIHRKHSTASINENLWMQVAATSPSAENAFAMAATHFESRHFTFAIMVGYNDAQIGKVRSLLSSYPNSLSHPFLMLSICAELQLRRLEELVVTQAAIYLSLDKTRLHIRGTTRPNGSGWDIINELQARENLKHAEEEVVAIKYQLEKACVQGVSQLLESYQKKARTTRQPSTRTNINISYRTWNRSQWRQVGRQNRRSLATPSATGAQQAILAETEQSIEVTRLLSERFHDIFARLDGLSTKCQVCVEGLSFSAQLMLSELARQEAKTSARNTKFATVIAFVALAYLPITGVATVLSMPVFGWANDWKDIRFRRVSKADEDDQSAGGNTVLPVVSGYIWVYLLITVFTFIVTLIPYLYYVKDDDKKQADAKKPDSKRAGFQTQET
ncbi:hypothetical protein F5Y18DRAFT_436512 [Xylariaceae sp. FL1019]|nr:hypothetical protein F5Y18DRAFT_436512 [Xylariaceae sp. FL1019]